MRDEQYTGNTLTTEYSTDEQYMQRALMLAKRATGFTHPNPMVGAVVVKNGEIIGEGYHQKAGEAHAEVHALKAAGENAKGATLYVTLEPCAHYGKTPPCAKRVIEAGIKRVVVGLIDPNPLVAGKGIQMIRDAGIEVTTGILEKECAKLVEGFLTFIKTGKPFVTLKSAMSLDGKIATRTGHSQWITNETARKDGHILRTLHDAILTGIGTVLSDNPSLNCRWQPAEDTGRAVHQPDVIILDSLGRTPIGANIFKQANRKVYIFVSPQCEAKRIAELEAVGAQVVVIDNKASQQDSNKQLPIEEILTKIAELGYTSVLVEGGSQVIASFVEAKAFDKIVTYIGNTIIGGQTALGAISGQGIDQLTDGVNLIFESVTILDNNIRIESYLAGRSGAYVHGDH
ncbi:MAG: bifunctional diaminohydroxyphosphoribosylaminopyrimidine deaminase/5-amino-6-(5-phosphoribosylamino)uracil reductase RibD [Veillonella sp.]|uniref:bifunctional diaminohydroxyphosphoribosylaminopyrimidine deaminase/5-amino-6-(5-phosphoribosylamino)uracil reductase RibD n=1 Tax=Veillonella sp. TaxID=1926307 RepID=UPI0025CD31C3|nr:bifunctional diaminohydroxyphosphoribosylaminopyrimidine deaminase/5-amino-6-(5-phosphoribosylamino)uracil reductase RibD [Veillonella sp.]MBE6080383.1 bifunctional diaminohydroxyphosphoribosylaminopyrimidine deaminase/5-amino-6-(5-phosphoribosylamino)uracil reductase RibD [Veillonella sp.]